MIGDRADQATEVMVARAFRPPVRLSLLFLVLSCTDPRARPVTPTIQIQISPTQTVVSPGTLPHTVWALDADGLGLIRVSIGSPDSALSADSVRLPEDAFSSTQSYAWEIPAGMAPGTPVRLVAHVEDLTGLEAADTVVLQIEATPLSGARNRPRK